MLKHFDVEGGSFFNINRDLNVYYNEKRVYYRTLFVYYRNTALRITPAALEPEFVPPGH